MTTRGRHPRRGATSGDVLIVLATLGVAAALLYPAWSVHGFRARVARAVTDVETVAAGARAFRDSGRRWPTPAPPGEAPPELAGLGGEEGPFRRLDYSLGWTSWEVVDSVEAPPPEDTPVAGDAPPASQGPRMEPVVRQVGAVTVHSQDDGLLAELLDHFAAQTSFVLDTMWLLVLPERAQAP